MLQGGGSAEVFRFIFAQAEVAYEDRRVEYSGEEWAKLKPTTPTGQLPMLEIEGKTLTGCATNCSISCWTIWPRRHQ